MPTLTPSYLPPPAFSVFPSPPCASSNGTRFSATTPTSPKQDAVEQRSDMLPIRKRALKVPFVKLDTPTIQEDMAASLAVALLGHVLFLKSQVPFPVAQLGRVPGSSSTSRAAKKRSEMINAFDELSSHLHTTFSALSTALARNPAHRSSDTVYIALVLGPTIGAPKARVILVLEGLEVKIWGERKDIGEEDLLPSEGGDDEDSSSDDGSEAEDDSTHEDHDAEEEDTDSTSVVGDGDAEESASSPPASEPPSSRSPSPSSGSEGSSRPSSPVPVPALESSIRRPLRPSLSPKSSQSGSPASRPYLAPKPARTHAEGQQALRAAERLLARTLVNAYAEGGGMAAELAPTQTHVLLRAPRRFSHPAWLPRQNVCTSLDNMLRDFQVDSGLGDAEDGKPRRRHGVAGVKTEGVLVGCQTSLDDSISYPTNPMTEINEEDELIWWAWDGKLVGFAEW